MLSLWLSGFHIAQALTIDKFVTNVETLIINPIIIFMVALAILMFIWGVVEFLMNQNGGEESKLADGKRHILWGLIGLMIMLSVYGILRLIVTTFGLEGPPGTTITFPH